jgi:hypothetical protein
LKKAGGRKEKERERKIPDAIITVCYKHPLCVWILGVSRYCTVDLCIGSTTWIYTRGKIYML